MLVSLKAASRIDKAARLSRRKSAWYTLPASSDSRMDVHHSQTPRGKDTAIRNGLVYDTKYLERTKVGRIADHIPRRPTLADSNFPTLAGLPDNPT